MEGKAIKWGIIGTIFIIAFFWTALFIENIRPEENEVPVDVVPEEPAQQYSLYTDPEGRFTVEYPQEFSVSSSTFTVPESMATGTNLSLDSRITINSKDAGLSCSALDFDEYSSAREEPSQISINGKSYSVLSSSGAGAGNFYEYTIYAFEQEGVCYGFELLIHTTNVMNYDPGTKEEFDRSVLVEVFERMLSSFK